MRTIQFRALGLSLIIGAFLCPEMAVAGCSADDIRSYMESGATAAQLNEACGQQGAPDSRGSPPANWPQRWPNYDSSYRPAVAAACVTQWGVCAMQELVPVGSGCVCYTQRGRFPGVAQ